MHHRQLKWCGSGSNGDDEEKAKTRRTETRSILTESGSIAQMLSMVAVIPPKVSLSVTRAMLEQLIVAMLE